jgi:hypothetical protein
MTALWATVIAALLAGPAVVILKARIDKRHEQAEDAKADRATIATLVDKRIDRLFSETVELRKQYREDLADVREQLKVANGRVAQLEREVAEWRAGIRGVVGVWVAVPASVWEYARDHLPELPPTRFPGESDSHTLD